MTRGHAEALVPMARSVAAAAGISLSEIELVGVTRGPGSFTGLRTGIAAARGFALASGAPAIGVSSLHAVASGAARTVEPTGGILCILDTRRADYYVQQFDARAIAVGDAAVLTAAEIRPLLAGDIALLAGNAVTRVVSELPQETAGLAHAPGPGCPDPFDVAVLAEAISDKEGLAPDTLSPLYLRAPEAKIPANRGRLK